MRKIFKDTLVVCILIMFLSTSVFASLDKPVESRQVKVNPTNATVLVNKNMVQFDSYLINGYNYFKLRDLAKAVDGTEKQFEVKWNDEKKSIELISNKSYTEVGGELVAGNGKEKLATLNSSTIYKDGEKIDLEAYTINGNNYFKLRDIAKIFDIGVIWDEDTQTVGIDTTTGYETAEETTEELKIESASFISGSKILVKFNKPIPADKAGEVFSTLIYIDWDGLSPWESGFFPNLVEGETELVVEFGEGSDDYQFPGPGKYEIYIGDIENIQGPIIELPEELLK